MENKNFEKKDISQYGISLKTAGYNDGYNTCLDRTNAKGLKEALHCVFDEEKSINHHLWELAGILPKSETKWINWLNRQANFIETELKKAEEHGVDKSNG